MAELTDRSTPVDEPQERVFEVDLEVDALIGRLRRGAGDPTMRRGRSGWWRATRTPQGPATMRISRGRAATTVQAWGPGAGWMLEHAPDLLGLNDDLADFRPGNGLVGELARRHPRLRIGRTNAVMEALVPSILEQKVTGAEAYSAFARLVRRFGDLAPGPASVEGTEASGLRLQPSPQQWQELPSWEWRKSMVEDKRSSTVIRAVRRASALERTVEAEDNGESGRADQADGMLRSLPGVGAWTSAEVRAVAHGDPDAWSIGDYHIPRQIVLVLSGADVPREEADARASELLEPWRGHRLRVQQLVMATGKTPPRRGPRRSLPTHFPR